MRQTAAPENPRETPLTGSLAPRVDAVVGALPGDGLRIAPSGRWTAAELADEVQWRILQRQLAKLPGGTSPRASSPNTRTPLSWSLHGLAALDHVGAHLLWTHWGRQWPAHLDATPMQRGLLERVARFSQSPPEPPRRTWARSWLILGAWVLQGVDHARAFTVLLGQLVLDLGRLLRHPRRGPWRDVSAHLFHFGASALPITALVGFLIGVVLAYLSAQQLRQFGADAFIVDLLGVSLVRELGPMLAAILIAGRSGSAITAQIGVMRVTQELDALRVMGISPGYRLVMPRALALAVAMPLIGLWTTLAALLGGMLAADMALGISPSFFWHALPSAVDAANLGLAVAKTTTFGWLIALVACHFGLRIEPNTDSLGQGTTASVVASITVVILVDAVFAILFKDVGT